MKKRIDKFEYKGRIYVYFFIKERDKPLTFYVKMLAGYKNFKRERFVYKKTDTKTVNRLLHNTNKEKIEKIIKYEIDQHSFKSRKRKLRKLNSL